MIPGDLLSAFPNRQFHILPGLLDSQAVLPNSYPNALRAMQGGSLYHFYDGLWYDPAERQILKSVQNLDYVTLIDANILLNNGCTLKISYSFFTKL